MAEISKITLPSGTSYDLKDATAREMISGGISFIVSTDASTTPAGVTWKSGSTTITGTLVASKDTKAKFYLVPEESAASPNAYREYVTVENGGNYSWEKIGSKDIDLSNYAKKGDGVTVSGTAANAKTGISIANHTVTQGTTSSNVYYTKDEVLGSGTTFTNAPSAVSFTGNASDTFVKSYPGATSKMVTGSVKGVSGSTSVTGVKDTTTTATKISNFGTQASWTATVANETLTIGWTPNTIAAGSNVTVPVKADAATTVPVADAEATTFATGALASNGGGASVMTGLGTASTASAVTNVGTGTAAAQAITVGTGDKVNAVVAISGTTSTGASSATISGTNSGIAVSAHSVTDNGHTHTVSGSGTIDA